MMEKSEKKFEDALRGLEEIVERLESGDLALEESLSAFEEGVALVRYLNNKLNEVERRVEVLTRDQGGNLRVDELADEEPE
jgi:exodeoxyribonuclease VII small subunit